MKTAYIFAASCLLLATVSCKKFVEVKAPYTQITTGTVFKDASSATAAQADVYVQMQYLYLPFNIARRTGAYADELTNYSTGDVLSRPMYMNTLTPFITNSCWTNLYSMIYQANAVIENLTASATVSTDIKNQLLGEARFSRALLYFYLVNLYGDAPYVTSTDYNQNSLQPRTAVAQVYEHITDDCKTAISLLSDHFIYGTSMAVSTERTRPTKWAAMSLLARTYLYTKNYSGAEAMADSVINQHSLFSLNTDLNTVFLKNSNEAIWQLEKPANLSYTSEGANFRLQFYLNTYGENQSSAISTQLLNAFETGDTRSGAWIGTYTEFTGVTYPYPNKYQEGYTSAPTEYPVVIRLAELYLIRAEALAQQQKITDAITDINTIRARAGLTGYAGQQLQQPVLDAVLHERQVELFTEWGHRWLDLKRMNKAETVMSVVTPLKGGPAWNANLRLWPIPQSERSSNQNLSQNPGY